MKLTIDVISEVVKDVAVTGCVLLLTFNLIPFIAGVKKDISELKISTIKTENQIRLLVLDVKEKTIMDKEYMTAMKNSTTNALQNITIITGEMAQAIREFRETVKMTNHFIAQLDDNINNKLLPTLIIQVQETGTRLALVLDNIEAGTATFTAQSENLVDATQKILLHMDEVIAQNKDVFNRILEHTDTVLINVGSMTGHMDKTAAHIEYFVKDTLKPKRLIVTIASGIIGAVLPRIIP